MINKQLGEEFVSLAAIKKRGTVIYIGKNLKPKLVFEDPDGRFVASRVFSETEKNIDTFNLHPQWCKRLFSLRKLKLRLQELAYDQLLMVGDFNGTINNYLDQLGKKED